MFRDVILMIVCPAGSDQWLPLGTRARRGTSRIQTSDERGTSFFGIHYMDDQDIADLNEDLNVAGLTELQFIIR